MMKSFFIACWWFAFVALLSDATVEGIPSSSPPRRRLQRKKIQFFGPEPDPVLMETTFPLKECQGACLKDDHCGHLLVCKLKKSSTDFPCAVSEKDTRTYVGERFCVQPDVGEEKEEGSEANGAVVLSVNVLSREEVLAQEAAEAAAANNNGDQAVAGDQASGSEQQRQDEPKVESLVSAELELQQQAEENSGGPQSSSLIVAVVGGLAVCIFGLI